MATDIFPEVVETERLVLRWYSSGDAPGLLQLVEENRPHLIREFAQIAGLRTLEDANSFIVEKIEQCRSAKTFCYGIWRKGQDGQLGPIQVKNIAWEIPSAELGYFVGTSCQRQGYASESMRRILELAFLHFGFQRIFLRVLPSNHANLSLAKKLGFQEEGLHRNAFHCGLNELHDVRYLSLIRDGRHT